MQRHSLGAFQSIIEKRNDFTGHILDEEKGADKF